MIPRRAGELLGRDVRYRDIRLGVCVDVLLDPGSRRVVGFEVVCRDDARRFLPLAACEVAGDYLGVTSPLVLVEDAFYRQRGRSLAELRGRPVLRVRRDLGRLRDLVLDDEGHATAVVVDRGEPAEVPLDDSVVFGGETLRPAV